LDTFLALVIILGFVIIINFCLQLLFYIKTKSKTYFYQAAFWVMSFFNLLCSVFLIDGQMSIILAQASGMPAILFLTNIAARFTEIKVSYKKYILAIFLALSLSCILTRLGHSFEISAIPVALIVGSPTFIVGLQIFKKARKKNILFYGLSIFMIINGIHQFDFPFLRMNPMYLAWGFSLYFLILQALAIIIPALTLIDREEKTAQELRDQVIEKTKELQRNINLKDITYQVLVHDFANYVFALQGGTRSLKRTQLDKDQLCIIGKNEDIQNRMKSLIHEIRQLERMLLSEDLNEQKFEYHGLLEMITSLEKSFSTKLETKNIEIKKEINPKWEVKVYEPFFSTSIIGNYLSNAIKFSEENGKILISSEITDQEELHLIIKDFGIGISQDDIEKMNDFSAPTRRIGTHREKGTGLGTLIANNYLKLHGLKVHFESREANPDKNISGETTITIIFTPDRFKVN
jgi:signal transduction histidine kinase